MLSIQKTYKMHLFCVLYTFDPYHRRRTGTETKTKVVASIWGAKIVQFLAVLAFLTRSIWN